MMRPAIRGRNIFESLVYEMPVQRLIVVYLNVSYIFIRKKLQFPGMRNVLRYPSKYLVKNNSAKFRVEI